MSRFDIIYEKERWGKGKGSGDGSHPDYCVAYLDYVRLLLDSGLYDTVLDIGCGDWQASRHVDWSSVWYLGVDVVQSILPSRPSEHHSARFKVADCTLPGTVTELFSIKRWDLVLIKDVMQHWSDEEIRVFVDEFRGMPWKTVVVVNDHRFSRAPEKNGAPRTIKNLYSWSALPYNHHTLEPLGLTPVGYYPRNKRKQISRADR